LEFFGFLKFNTDSYIKRLDGLLLTFFSIAILSSNLGSLGRFAYVFYLFSIIKLLYLSRLNINNKHFKTMASILLPILVLHVVLSLRAGFYSVDPYLIIGNPILFLFTQSDISLSEFLVGH
jgi:hypothetical protein